MANRRSSGAKHVVLCSGVEDFARVPEFKFKEEYKDRVALLYDRYSEKYDNGTWHDEIGRPLIEGCGLRKGDRVLDMCAGTGISTLISADLVGREGRVVGVDFSDMMLKKAREKVKTGGYAQVELVLGDAEKVEFPPRSFDCITCCAAFLWMTDYVGTLTRWRGFLAPGGQIALHAFWEGGWVKGVCLVKAAARHGVELTFNQPTGTEERVARLLAAAGYSDVRIERYEVGSYISLEDAEKGWDGMVKEEFPFSPPLFEVSQDVRDAIKASYLTELQSIATDRGVWEDRTTFHTHARNLS
ncbi:hypothetical protein BSKO_12800 [Bryopsis sp. KO-2023]|nr:hypothetical protein BSKO_12800 [Bryopsis sp. KO-2023]